MGGTRVIYQEGKREASISVTNADTRSPFLVQSWVENYSETDKSRAPFIVTPPLFRLDPNSRICCALILPARRCQPIANLFFG